MHKQAMNLNMSSETTNAVFIVAFAAIFILANLTIGFVWPLYLLAMIIGFLLAFKQPRSGLLAMILLTLIFERFFTLQTFFIGKVEYKLYPLDIIMFGIIAGLFWQYLSGRAKKFTWQKADHILLIFILINAVYFLASVFVLNGEKNPAFSTLKNYGFYPLLYFVTAYVIQTKDDLQKVFQFFLAGALAILAFLAIGLVTGQGLWSEYTPLSTAGVRILAFPHGLYLSLALIPLIIWNLAQKPVAVWQKAVFLVWSIGIAGTLMRHLWIALAATLLLLYAFTPAGKKSALRKIALSLAAPIALAAAIIFYGSALFPQSELAGYTQKVSGIVSERAGSISNIATDESYSWRSLVWQGAYQEFKKNPVFGIGTGRKIYVENPAYKYQDFVEVRNIHNSYLAVLIQLGIVGFAALAYFLWLSLKNLLKMTTDDISIFYKFSVFAVLATYLISFNFQPYLETNLLSLFFWIALGLVRNLDMLKVQPLKISNL